MNSKNVLTPTPTNGCRDVLPADPSQDFEGGCRQAFLRCCIRVIGGLISGSEALSAKGEAALKAALKDLQHPFSILETCCEGPQVSTLHLALEPWCDVEVLVDLLEGVGCPYIPVVNLNYSLDGAILQLLTDTGSVDRKANRLTKNASKKLSLLFLAATGGIDGNLAVALWAINICRVARAEPKVGMPAFLSLLETVIANCWDSPRAQLVIQCSSGTSKNDPAAPPRFVCRLDFWFDVFSKLWQHPRACKGTMRDVVDTSFRLMSMEKNMRESLDGTVGNLPWFVDTLRIAAPDGQGKITLRDLVNNHPESFSPSSSFDLTLDDVDPKYRPGDDSTTISCTDGAKVLQRLSIKSLAYNMPA